MTEKQRIRPKFFASGSETGAFSRRMFGAAVCFDVDASGEPSVPGGLSGHRGEGQVFNTG
ncbi:MAG: hypothetical protein ACYTBJ_12555 [Planctomycetota bacterium]|jgi:hypothetical protein